MEETKNGSETSKHKTTCVCPSGCGCGCGNGCNRRIICWLVGIFILVIVFAIGMKAGEFRDELRSTYGGYYHSYPMMQRYQQQGGVPTAAYPSEDNQGAPTGTPTGL